MPGYYSIKNVLPQVEKKQRELHRLAYGPPEWAAARAAVRVDNFKRAIDQLDPSNIEHQRLIRMGEARLSSASMNYKTLLGHLVNKDLAEDQYLLVHSSRNHINQMKTLYEVSGIKRNDFKGFQRGIAKLEEKQSKFELNAEALLTGVEELVEEKLEDQESKNLQNLSKELEHCDLEQCLPSAGSKPLPGLASHLSSPFKHE